jgi:hypothetical protein
MLELSKYASLLPQLTVTSTQDEYRRWKFFILSDNECMDASTESEKKVQAMLEKFSKDEPLSIEERKIQSATNKMIQLIRVTSEDTLWQEVSDELNPIKIIRTYSTLVSATECEDRQIFNLICEGKKNSSSVWDYIRSVHCSAQKLGRGDVLSALIVQKHVGGSSQYVQNTMYRVLAKEISMQQALDLLRVVHNNEGVECRTEDAHLTIHKDDIKVLKTKHCESFGLNISPASNLSKSTLTSSTPTQLPSKLDDNCPYDQTIKSPNTSFIDSLSSVDCILDDEVYHTVMEAEKQASDWIVDSGASIHLTNDPTILKYTRKLSVPVAIRVASNHTVYAKESGTAFLSFQTDNGEVWRIELENVFYISNIRRNLLSVKQLAKCGFEMIFRGFLHYLSQRTATKRTYSHRRSKRCTVPTSTSARGKCVYGRKRKTKENFS